MDVGFLSHILRGMFYKSINNAMIVNGWTVFVLINYITEFLSAFFSILFDLLFISI